MTERPAILSAKVLKLAEIMSDGQAAKQSGSNTVSEARSAQENAAREVLEAGGSVASVENVKLPSERL